MSDALVAAYDCATGVGQTRAMTNAEFLQWEADQAAAALVVAESSPKPPPAADAVLEALTSLDPDKASVADVVNLVKAALAKAGAVPAV